MHFLSGEARFDVGGDEQGGGVSLHLEHEAKHGSAVALGTRGPGQAESAGERERLGASAAGTGDGLGRDVIVYQV